MPPPQKKSRQNHHPTNFFDVQKIPISKKRNKQDFSVLFFMTKLWNYFEIGCSKVIVYTFTKVCCPGNAKPQVFVLVKNCFECLFSLPTLSF